MRKAKKAKPQADICLFLEGTYPYVSGGVSSWVHELIEAHNDLNFHLVALLAPGTQLKQKYTLPENVLQIDHVYLQQLAHEKRVMREGKLEALCQKLEGPLINIQTNPKLKYLQQLIDVLEPYQGKIGQKGLMDSEAAWRMLLRMYHATLGDNSFLDYFWSWRALFGGLYSVMLAPLPEAKVYHSLCTGYAGLFLARAHLVTGKPCIITEHGIYTNERKIEIASADWLEDQKSLSLAIKKAIEEKELRDFWVDTFSSYSKLCYAACTEIITLYEGNQEFQIADGADPDKMRVVVNGIDYERYSQIKKSEDHAPTLALIGRVVPIKDIKSFIRVVGLVRDAIPEVEAFILGPMDEDEEYYNECVELQQHLHLEETLTFTGKAKIDEYLPRIDVLVLTSISEAQPLVILEAGAAGVPTVATNVGACAEMILGHHSEDPYLGEGGAIAPLSNPQAMTTKIIPLLMNRKLLHDYSESARKRVETYYNKKDQHRAYDALYKELCAV